MTEAERRAYRIARNREFDALTPSKHGGFTLEGIVARLNADKKRATYGAVAEVVGVLPRGLMTGRPKSPEYSWVVAASGASRGRPTGYTVNQIHPECRRQICESVNDIIDTAAELRKWLQTISSSS